MPIELGKFEQWLMDHFFLLGEELFVMHSGQPVKFYRGKGGWKFTKLDYFGWKKKNVSEHRMKFLPAHRWLPTTVDHDNGVRDDNHLITLSHRHQLSKHSGQRKRRNCIYRRK